MLDTCEKTTHTWGVLGSELFQIESFRANLTDLFREQVRSRPQPKQNETKDY